MRPEPRPPLALPASHPPPVGTSPAVFWSRRSGRAAGLVVAWAAALALLAVALAEPAWESLAQEADRSSEPAPLRPGWGRVVVGIPSGATSTLPTAAELDPDPVPALEPIDPLPEERPLPADFELVVPRGAVLSTLVQNHYGTIRGGLVDAIARYNGLESADALRVGQKLFLPSLELLERATSPATPLGLPPDSPIR